MSKLRRRESPSFKVRRFIGTRKSNSRVTCNRPSLINNPRYKKTVNNPHGKKSIHQKL